MNHLVLLQVAPDAKSLGAEAALEGLLSGVRVEVRSQRLLQSERL